MTNYETIIYDKKIRDRFLEIVDEKTYHREIIFAKQAFDNSDVLQRCTVESIRNALVNIALTGASLNPVLQQAFLIPRRGKCCLDFSYRGLIKIATDSGGVLDIDATVVYENDLRFHYEMGLKPILKHVPALSDQGKPTHVYAIAILASGIKKFIVLNKEEIEKVKKNSLAFSKGADTPWKGDFEPEMWRKTAVKKLYKLLPQSERMSTAVSILNEHEGIDFNSQEKAKEVMERFNFKQDKKPEIEAMAPFPCPNNEQITYTKKHCDNDCPNREGCPAWGTIDAHNS